MLRGSLRLNFTQSRADVPRESRPPNSSSRWLLETGSERAKLLRHCTIQIPFAPLRSQQFKIASGLHHTFGWGDTIGAFVFNVSDSKTEPLAPDTRVTFTTNTSGTGAALPTAIDLSTPPTNEVSSLSASAGQAAMQATLRIERPAVELRIDNVGALISRTLAAATLQLYASPPEGGSRYVWASGSTMQLPAGQAAGVAWPPRRGGSGCPDARAGPEDLDHRRR
jgi:hypothetical protein